MFLKSDTRGSSPEGRKATALIGEFGERTRPPWPAFHSASNGPLPTDEGCGFPSQSLTGCLSSIHWFRICKSSGISDLHIHQTTFISKGLVYMCVFQLVPNVGGSNSVRN